jgi:hypothetical protein
VLTIHSKLISNGSLPTVCRCLKYRLLCRAAPAASRQTRKHPTLGRQSPWRTTCRSPLRVRLRLRLFPIPRQSQDTADPCKCRRRRLP